MARVMPPKGYYVLTQVTVNGTVYPVINHEVIFSTGTKSQNHYFRPNFHVKTGWHKLAWTCVPGAKPIATDYKFYPTFQDFEQGRLKGEHTIVTPGKCPADL